MYAEFASPVTENVLEKQDESHVGQRICFRYWKTATGQERAAAVSCWMAVNTQNETQVAAAHRPITALHHH